MISETGNLGEDPFNRLESAGPPVGLTSSYCPHLYKILFRSRTSQIESKLINVWQFTAIDDLVEPVVNEKPEVIRERTRKGKGDLISLPVVFIFNFW